MLKAAEDSNNLYRSFFDLRQFQTYILFFFFFFFFNFHPTLYFTRSQMDAWVKNEDVTMDSISTRLSRLLEISALKEQQLQQITIGIYLLPSYFSYFTIFLTFFNLPITPPEHNSYFERNQLLESSLETSMLSIETERSAKDKACEEILTLQSALALLKDQLKRSDTEISNLNSELSSNNSQLDAANKQIKELKVVINIIIFLSLSSLIYNICNLI